MIILSGKGRAFSSVKCLQDAFLSMGFLPIKIPISGSLIVMFGLILGQNGIKTKISDETWGV
jgi:hypothetical protein